MAKEARQVVSDTSNACMTVTKAMACIAGLEDSKRSVLHADSLLRQSGANANPALINGQLSKVLNTICEVYRMANIRPAGQTNSLARKTFIILEMRALNQIKEIYEGLKPFTSHEPLIQLIRNSQLFLKSEYCSFISQNANIIGTTHELQEKAAIENQKILKKQLMLNPIQVYQEMTASIQNDPNANFSVYFESVLTFLELKVSGEAIKCKENILLEICHDTILIDIRERIRTGCPYLKTLVTINETMKFFALLSDYSPKKESYPINFQAMMTCPAQIILLPSLMSFGASDFLKLHGIPIGLLGITTFPKFADGAYMNPLQFFMHDAEHENAMYFKPYWIHMYAPTTNPKQIQDSQTFFRAVILPIITNQSDPLHNVKKMIFFEWQHESFRVRTHTDRFYQEFCPLSFEITEAEVTTRPKVLVGIKMQEPANLSNSDRKSNFVAMIRRAYSRTSRLFYGANSECLNRIVCSQYRATIADITSDREQAKSDSVELKSISKNNVWFQAGKEIADTIVTIAKDSRYSNESFSEGASGSYEQNWFSRDYQFE